MPDFFLKFFWSCTLADNGLSIWATKNASCMLIMLWTKVVVTGCGRLWSVFVMSVLAINMLYSIGTSKLQWINGSMEDLSDGSMEELRGMRTE